MAGFKRFIWPIVVRLESGQLSSNRVQRAKHGMAVRVGIRVQSSFGV